MARREENIKGLHIKPHTKGTSNELSFSVLHKLRSTAIEQDRDSDYGVQRDSSLSLRWIGISVLFLSVVVALIIGASLLFGFFSNQANVKSDLVGVLGVIDESDKDFLVFDGLVTAQLNTDAASTDYQELQDQWSVIVTSLDGVNINLQNAKQLATDIGEELALPAEKDVATQAIISINARLSMLEAGKTIVTESLKAAQVQEYVDTAWENIVEGDEFARAAAETLTSFTTENVERSMEMSREAQRLFIEARDKLTSADELFIELDIDTFLQYLNLRIDAQEAAIDSDQAFLNRDKEGTQSSSDRYNDLEQQASELIENIDKTIIDKADEYLFNRIYNETNDYVTQRLQAGGADQILRDYLGTSGK